MDDAASRDPTEGLLKRSHDGNAAAVQALLLRDVDWVRGFVHRHLGKAARRLEDTEDAVQELMVTVLTSGQRFVVDSHEDFRRLVATIVLNRLRSQGRRLAAAKRDPGKERELGTDSVLYLSGDQPARCVTRPEQRAEREEAIALIRLAKDLLDPELCYILDLRDQGLEWQEIGTRLGCAEDAARKRHGKAVRQLERLVVELRSGRLRAILPQ
jgi:RNA polymerase sigma factor (sigma-70 family)